MSAAVSLVDPAAAAPADVVIIGALSPASGLVLAPGAEAIDKAMGGRLLAGLRAVGAKGRADEVTKIPTLGLTEPPLIVVAGLGDQDPAALDAEVVRREVGAALRALSGTARVHIAIGGTSSAPGADTALLAAIAEGALMGAYSFTIYKSSPPPTPLRRLSIAAASPRDRLAKAALKRAQIVADAVTATRDLVNTAPNELYPQTLAERTAEMGRAAGLTVEVLDERALKRGGYGGILGVGAGSVRPPRLVRLTYAPPRAKTSVALVGKGITFDSGGLNIKSAMMDWMKSDMSGAAAVAATIVAAAALRLPINITATIPMAENMPSGSSYRPSDVLTFRGGRTVEINNTDAEGRIILADAIVRAAEDKPDYLIETSTLTGAQMVSLGTRVVGAMGSDDFRDLVVAAGGRAGESLWPMPLPPELRPGIDSAIADITQVTGDRWGGMLVAGHFLSTFVPTGLPWVHLDIAGPAWNAGGPHGYTPKGGTGVIVRTMLATLEELAGA
ncbi:MAG: pepA [Jatrophihabitantaceae bacterium]|nr:pepA [Jatrophihabitantaceae bacterium]